VALSRPLHRRSDQVRDPRTEQGRLRIPRLAALFVAALVLFGPIRAGEIPDAAPGEFPEGAAGYILTVLSGREIERIPLTYLGKFEEFLGPGYGIHLVRLEGPAAEKFGIASGMSGSPVYVEGRLIGALSYRLGQYPKEAIGGVTPIEAIRSAARSAATAAPVSDLASPIATPLASSGLHPQLREWAREQLEALGLVWSDGLGTSGSGDAGEGVFEGGSPIGVALARGDWSFAATGTVTAVEDGIVYAFGHPFMGTGAVRFPMHEATVVHTLADALGSRKLATIGDEVGVITDDRLTAIVGNLNDRVAMIPMDIRVHSAGSDTPRNAHVEFVDVPGLTPLLAALSVSNSIFRHVEHEVTGTVLSTGTVRLLDRPDVPFELAAASESGNPMGVVAAKVQQILSALWNNPFERPVVEGIDVDIEVSPDIHNYFIESLQYDRKAIEPGGVLRVQAVLKPWRGEKVHRQLELRLPHGAKVGSTLRVAVGSPQQVERALGNPLARRLSTSEDLAGVIRVIGEMKAENRLMAVLYDDSPTVVRDGAVFSKLPATAAHLLSTGARSGAATHSRVSRLATTQVELDGPVGGGLTIGVMVAGGESSEDPKESPDMKAPE